MFINSGCLWPVWLRLSFNPKRSQPGLNKHYTLRRSWRHPPGTEVPESGSSVFYGCSTGVPGQELRAFRRSCTSNFPTRESNGSERKLQKILEGWNDGNNKACSKLGILEPQTGDFSGGPGRFFNFEGGRGAFLTTCRDPQHDAH